MDTMTEVQDPVFKLPWTKATLSEAYAFFQIKDESSFCSKCHRITARVLDGRCFTCHRNLFQSLGRTPCPPLP